jgi:hypothetical protein
MRTSTSQVLLASGVAKNNGREQQHRRYHAPALSGMGAFGAQHSVAAMRQQQAGDDRHRIRHRGEQPGFHDRQMPGCDQVARQPGQK